jgi:hypothetical protein
MFTASLANQLAHVLNALFWDTEDIEAYKAEHGVVSVKRDLRLGGDPTRPIPAILSYRTRACYFQIARTFFKRAKEQTGQRRLADLLVRLPCAGPWTLTTAISSQPPSGPFWQPLAKHIRAVCMWVGPTLLHRSRTSCVNM